LGCGSNEEFESGIGNGRAAPAERPGEARHEQLAAVSHIRFQHVDLISGKNGGIWEEHDSKLGQPYRGRVFIQQDAPRNMFVEHGLMPAMEALEVAGWFFAAVPIPCSAAEINPDLLNRLFAKFRLLLVNLPK